jgi:hypothetical protein
MADVKSLRVFRNAGQKIFYLRRRPEQPTSAANFSFIPDATIRALDEAEDTMLATISADIRDVAKETPIMSNEIDDLKKRLEAARAENEQLKKDKADLETKSQAVKAQVASGGRQK